MRRLGSSFGTFFVAAALLSTGCQNRPQSVPADVAFKERETVATVDGRPLPPDDLNARFAAAIPSFAASDGTVPPVAAISAKLRITEQLIDEALVEAAATRQGLTVTDSDVDAWLATAQPGASDGTRDPDLRLRARREILADRLSGAAEVVVTDALIETYYRENIRAFDPPTGTSAAPPSIAQVQDEIRVRLTASLRLARRGELRRTLRATIPFSNQIALRYAPFAVGGAPSSTDLISGTPPPIRDGSSSTSNPLTFGR